MDKKDLIIALDEFEDRRSYYLDDKVRLKCYDLAIEALEKQTPKAVQTINDNESYFVCSCGFTVGYFEDFREHKYCLNCGQKLDWED